MKAQRQMMTEVDHLKETNTSLGFYGSCKAFKDSLKILADVLKQIKMHWCGCKDKLEESQLIHKRDAAIIESQKHLA